MSKKYLIIVLASASLLAVCLFLVVGSASKLPPAVVMPNAKPAPARPSSKTAMVVNASPVQQNVALASATTSKSVQPIAASATTTSKVADCNQSVAQPTQAASASAAAVSSVLTYVVNGTQTATKNVILGSQLQTSLQGVATSL